LREEPHTRLRHFCSVQHCDSALYPFIARLERAGGFERADDSAARLDKLEALLAKSSEVNAERAGLFADLLGLAAGGRYPAPPEDPQRRRDMTLAAFVEELATLSRRQPALLIFEDAQWADSTSLELLDRMVERAPRLPVLMIVTFRPDFSSRWMGQAHVASLRLSRLTRHETAALVDGVTGGKSLPPEVLDRIVQRTDGVPLFIEELTKSLLEGGPLREEAGGRALAIPSSLQDALMARLDRLAGAKQAAQTAAIIRREFSYALLRAVYSLSENELRRALRRLAESELIFQRGDPPHARYTFKHALVQDAAYQSLLRASRRVQHQRVAEALEKQFPETAETQPELLAHHYTEAGLAEPAIVYWRKAGERAAKRAANIEATDHSPRLGAAGSLAGPPRAR
jgi:predicted ATPase